MKEATKRKTISCFEIEDDMIDNSSFSCLVGDVFNATIVRDSVISTLRSLFLCHKREW